MDQGHVYYSLNDIKSKLEKSNVPTARNINASIGQGPLIIGGDFNLSLNIGFRGDVLKEFYLHHNLKIANKDGLNIDDNN